MREKTQLRILHALLGFPEGAPGRLVSRVTGIGRGPIYVRLAQLHADGFVECEKSQGTRPLVIYRINDRGLDVLFRLYGEIDW